LDRLLLHAFSEEALDRQRGRLPVVVVRVDGLLDVAAQLVRGATLHLLDRRFELADPCEEVILFWHRASFRGPSRNTAGPATSRDRARCPSRARTAPRGIPQAGESPGAPRRRLRRASDPGDAGARSPSVIHVRGLSRDLHPGRPAGLELPDVLLRGLGMREVVLIPAAGVAEAADFHEPRGVHDASHELLLVAGVSDRVDFWSDDSAGHGDLLSRFGCAPSSRP